MIACVFTDILRIRKLKAYEQIAATSINVDVANPINASDIDNNMKAAVIGTRLS